MDMVIVSHPHDELIFQESPASVLTFHTPTQCVDILGKSEQCVDISGKPGAGGAGVRRHVRLQGDGGPGLFWLCACGKGGLWAEASSGRSATNTQRSSGG